MKHNRNQGLSRREPRNAASGSSILPFISGMGFGAGIMYVLDPDRGNRRRSMAQQKLVRVAHLSGDAFDKAIRDLEHRTQGLFSDARCLVRRDKVSDAVLEERVRSKLGRVACHPGSIEVRATGANIVLSGPVLRGEEEEIVRAVRHVRGVRGVESRLEEHHASENLPGLQGRGQRPGDKPELLQENWAPGTRLVMGGLGAALIVRALRKPGILDAVGGLFGFALLARSGRHTRIADTLMDAIKPVPGPRTRRHLRVDQGVRTAGLGRTDQVGASGVYPMSGPLPPGNAEIRGQASWGQGERGAAGYADHGSSELTYSGGQVLGALSGAGGGRPDRAIDLQSLLRPREIPRQEWMHFLDQLAHKLSGCRVTVEVRDGANTRAEQRDIPLDGIGADVKDRESIVNVSVGRGAAEQVTHSIHARRVALRDQGDNKLLEIEADSGPTTVVRFHPADLSGRAA